MNCPNCHAANPDDKTYCGDCGSPLRESAERHLRRLVEAEVKAGFESRAKDQRSFELETTQAILTRLQFWVRLFLACVGLPLVLLAVLFGIKLADLSSLVNKAENEIGPKVQQALKIAQDANDKSGQAKDKANEAVRTAETVFEEANKQLASVKGSKQRIDDLNRQVADAKTQADNADAQIRSIVASERLTVPLITSIAARGSQVVIKGVNFGADFGHVRLRVRNATTNKEVVREMELKKDSISQWKDDEVMLRVPDSVINEVKDAEIEAAKTSAGGNVFGVKYEYLVQTANNSRSNWQAHVEWRVNLYESLKPSSDVIP
jgi:F0F1-type ATP synthase membrane subunit b/b'